MREASATCEEATANLAQLNAALGEHATAVSLYDTAIKRVKPAGSGESAGEPGTGARAATRHAMLMLQARSHYVSGKLAECRAVLCRAVRLMPSSHAAWHNLGIALLEAARHPDGPDALPRSVEAVVSAMAEAKRADALLRALGCGLPRPGNLADSANGLASDAGIAATTAEAAVAAFAAVAGADRPYEEGGPQADRDPGASRGAPFAPDAVAVVAAMATESALMEAESLGLTHERRRAALSACQIVLRELTDEKERAVEREQRETAEVAAADAKMREFEAARLAAEAAAVEKRRAEEEAHAAAIAEQKIKLAAKLEVWREADAAEAAAAAGERRKKRRKGEDAEYPAAPDSDEDDAARDGGDAEADLFGSDDDDGGVGHTDGDKAAAEQAMRGGSGVPPAGSEGDAEAAVDADLFEGNVGAAAEAGDARATKRRKVIVDGDEDEEDNEDEAPLLV